MRYGGTQFTFLFQSRRSISDRFRGYGIREFVTIQSMPGPLLGNDHGADFLIWQNEFENGLIGPARRLCRSPPRLPYPCSPWPRLSSGGRGGDPANQPTRPAWQPLVDAARRGVSVAVREGDGFFRSKGRSPPKTAEIGTQIAVYASPTVRDPASQRGLRKAVRADNATLQRIFASPVRYRSNSWFLPRAYSGGPKPRLPRSESKHDRADQEILLLRNFEGLSNQAASVVLEIEPDAASKRYGRALLRLRSVLLRDLPAEDHR